MIPLSKADKIVNYCDSCLNEIRNEEDVFCKLTSKEPDFKAICSNYQFDKTIDVEESRLSLGFDFYANNGGTLYPNQYFDLLDKSFKTTNAILLNVNSKKTFRSYSLFKAEYILIFVFIIGWALYNLIYKGVNEFLNIWFYGFIIMTALFIYIRGLFSHYKLVVDINGIGYNSSKYLWSAIEYIYLKKIDNGSETEGEEYMFLILASGKIIKLDTQYLDFLGVKRLKKILNFYRMESKKLRTTR